ncbi:MAG: DUF1080 domain-containing protein [Pirellulaceae bacterium]|nr:DUF1080 domain-containing protein [Pirellulaceae bacterium]
MKTICASLLLLIVTTSFAIAEPLVLEKGDRLAIVGDSITEQKLYSKFMDAYLLACYPDLEIQSFQFGWGGERAPGFAGRMENDLVPWKPDVVTTCYGMNDGSYRKYTDQIGKTYEEGMRKIVERMKKAGATVVVGSPGVVDSFTWRKDDADFDQVYNDNLGRLGQIAKQIAQEHGFPHADVFNAMKQSMVAAKASLGDEYPVAGRDGVHPEANGQLVMAYAFLKTLGLDGDIGTVVVDLTSDTATATDGHQVLHGENGAFEIESSRYPFCFSGDKRDPNGTASILPYTSFNQDLNRFVLKVKGLQAPGADVTFGSGSKRFSKAQLEKGINLAAEFLENPFVEPFQDVLNKVAEKQAAETTMIKEFITDFRRLPDSLIKDPEGLAALATVRQKMMDANDQAHAKAKAAVKPVRYQLAVKPITQGWNDLFNGKDLTGWTQRNGTASYRVENDAIVGTTSEGSPNSFLCTDQVYGNFELQFDVKVDRELNSGVQIRSQSVGGKPEGRVNGPQVEISLDGLAGYLYGESAGGWMTPDADRKPHQHFKDGEWNNYRVVAFGNQIQTWINGHSVSNLTHDERYQSHPKGFIGLQVHGIGRGEGPYEVRWRNLKLRDLSKFTALYNGKDLKGWQTSGNWLPQQDGSVLIQPRDGERGWQRYGDYLWSTRQYKDFVLDVEYSYPPGGNSGVYFRVADRKDPVKQGIEAQILDSSKKTGKLSAHDHGGIVGTVGPSKNMSRPPHEWNRMVVTCIGNHLQVELNGEPIIDTQLDEGAMKDRPLEGFIGFQDHGQPNNIKFRNLRILEIKTFNKVATQQLRAILESGRATPFTVTSWLAAGADVNSPGFKRPSPDNPKHRPLLLAALNVKNTDRAVEVMGVLLEAGADVNGRNPGGLTAAMGATSRNSGRDCNTVLRLLLDAGTDPNLKQESMGANLLHWVIIGSSYEAVQMVLNTDVDVNQADNKGRTPFTLAMLFMSPKIAARLLEAGAKVDPNFVFKNGLTVLEYARSRPKSFKGTKVLAALEEAARTETD